MTDTVSEVPGKDGTKEDYARTWITGQRYSDLGGGTTKDPNGVSWMGDRFPRRPELGGAMVEQCFENVRSKKKKKKERKCQE